MVRDRQKLLGRFVISTTQGHDQYYLWYVATISSINESSSD